MRRAERAHEAGAANARDTARTRSTAWSTSALALERGPSGPRARRRARRASSRSRACARGAGVAGRVRGARRVARAGAVQGRAAEDAEPPGGRRVTAVILSGALDCGTAGLMVVRARGGLTLVTAPRRRAGAVHAPRALKHVQVDHVGSASDLGAYLARAVAEPLPAEEAGAASGERVPGEPPTEGAPLADVCARCARA